MGFGLVVGCCRFVGLMRLLGFWLYCGLVGDFVLVQVVGWVICG